GPTRCDVAKKAELRRPKAEVGRASFLGALITVQCCLPRGQGREELGERKRKRRRKIKVVHEMGRSRRKTPEGGLRYESSNPPALKTLAHGLISFHEVAR